MNRIMEQWRKVQEFIDHKPDCEWKTKSDLCTCGIGIPLSDFNISLREVDELITTISIVLDKPRNR